MLLQLLFPAGPCVSTDTACSSSLVATHLAHTGLMLEECGTAVSAGSNIMLLAGTTAAICQLQALSPVGRCKTFEASGDGYGRGEGVAAVVLCRQQHNISSTSSSGGTSGSAYALLHGSAVNQGGRSSGLTAPNGPAQTALVRTALAAGRLAASQLGLVSVHGTGTPLGDPIEVGALAQALRGSGIIDSGAATLASNKACFGHTEGSAGITGLLLAVTALHREAAPEVRHLRSLNPYVANALGDWSRSSGGGSGSGSTSTSSSAVRALRQNAPIMLANSGDSGSSQAAKLAGTSSFGMSGVNAHMIVGRGAGSIATAPAHPATAWAWQRSRHHVLVQPHALLLAAAGLQGSGTTSFSFAPVAPHLPFLWDYQLCGRAFVSLGALTEMATAAACAYLGDAADLQSPAAAATVSQQCLLLGAAAVPALVELPEEMTAAPALVCTISAHTQQLVLASSGGSSQGMTCFSAGFGTALVVKDSTLSGHAGNNLTVSFCI